MIEEGVVEAVRAGNGKHVVLVVQADCVVTPLRKSAVDCQTCFCFAAGASEEDDQPMVGSRSRIVKNNVWHVDCFNDGIGLSRVDV